MSAATVAGWRRGGPAGLASMKGSGRRALPPRLPEKPIFGLVGSEAYAATIARDRNVPASGAGHVTRVATRRDMLDGDAARNAGRSGHREDWIPADALPALVDRIGGRSEGVRSLPR